MRELFSAAKLMYVVSACVLGFIFFCITLPLFGSYVMKGDFLSPIPWSFVLITFLLFSSSYYIYKLGKRRIEKKLRELNFTSTNGLQLFNPIIGRYAGINLKTEKIVLISLASDKAVTEFPLNILSGYELNGSTIKLMFNDYDMPCFPLSNNSAFRSRLDVYLNS